MAWPQQHSREAGYIYATGIVIYGVANPCTDEADHTFFARSSRCAAASSICSASSSLQLGALLFERLQALRLGDLHADVFTSAEKWVMRRPARSHKAAAIVDPRYAYGQITVSLSNSSLTPRPAEELLRFLRIFAKNSCNIYLTKWESSHHNPREVSWAFCAVSASISMAVTVVCTSSDRARSSQSIPD